MLNLIKSNKMENLAQALCRVLAHVPEDPMAEEWIGIQSRGMRQWISQQIASTLGICANVSFRFPRQIMEALLDPGGTDAEIRVSEESLIWSVMDLLWDDPGHGSLATLKNYTRDDPGGRKLLQLSGRIARILDDYQVYRPDMLMDWQKTGKPRPAKDRATRELETWQVFLWNSITRNRPHFAARMDDFMNSAGPVNTGDIPPRICLFGISALPVSFLSLLSKAALHMEIYLFLLTPSSQFFFDIPTPRQAGRRILEEDDPDPVYADAGNPLLASLGRTGRDFHACLEELDYHEPFGDLFEDPGPDPDPAMLSVLQSDILHLEARKPGGPVLPVKIRGEDLSVSVHACHSPMREAQVLKDLLLDAFDRDPDLSPHEVIVMMPDVEAYAPYIESVFLSLPDREGARIPFSLSDRRKRIESPVIEGFLKILAMNRTRLEKSRVLELLRSDLISAKFSLSVQEVMVIEAAAGEAGILWGLDREHRKSLTGAGFAENTWMFGFDRLFLGYAAAGEVPMGKAVPARFFEGLEADVLGRFAHFAQTLFDFLRDLDRKRSVSGWASCFRGAALSMMEPAPEDEPDMDFLLRSIDEFAREAQEAGFERKIGFDSAREILEGKLDRQTAQGGFLAGSMTFCNLMPMRSIPFKVVALMGMGESAFPRSGFEPGFDLIPRSPRKGDKQARDEDRYLFLESVLSARQRLIITYTGMDIKDNSPIPCSGVVSELMDVMDQSFEFPNGFQYRFDHPLHGFSPVYFNSDPGYFSFSRELCAIARSQAGRQADKGPVPFLDRGGEGEPDLPAGRKIQSLSLEDLVRFFRNPAQIFVRQSLGLELPIPGEADLDRESFQISGLERFSLGSRILETGIFEETYDPADPGIKELYSFFRARGDLPLGRKGKTEFMDVLGQVRPLAEAAASLGPKVRMDPVSVDLNLLGIRVTGRIPDLYSDGEKTVRFVTGFGRLNPARLLSFWIHHLALNLALEPGQNPAETRAVGRDPQGKKEVIVCTIKPMGETAGPLLENLVRFYLTGRESFFPFFCNTCFSLVKALEEKKYANDPESLEHALYRSRSAWFNAYHQTGDGTDPYVRLCLGDHDPFDSVQTLVASQIPETATALFQPLLENLNLG
ncbi:exodeoxyribonuclease V subunit gamma [Desulfospira joergensenii]|uniref:exodeoxyribonuclease V subunit gamma n=1 Tax=Desulfospira joergensenii TaxID=53329 RepID=UPI0003B30890|nr:exodeoxyribonuclease V subunit gamma [Desulfospira joergensenii]